MSVVHLHTLGAVEKFYEVILKFLCLKNLLSLTLQFLQYTLRASFRNFVKGGQKLSIENLWGATIPH